jgi:MerR family transcriptional regulator, copper efflux regulator
MDELTIGKLAKQANVHVETVRYYERRGLIPRPWRTVANYRLYSPESLRQVKFIKQAQALGFSLKEIKQLLTLRATPRAGCADVRAYASQKIEDIEAKIRALARMRKALQNLRDECSGKGPATQCPILESLDSEQRMIDR